MQPIDTMTPDWQLPPTVKAVISGVTPDASPFGLSNLALHVDDQAGRVLANRKQLAAQLGVTHWQWLNQVHGTIVLNADVNTLATTPNADASTTMTPSLACCVLTADCLPVLISNKQGTQVAAAHAGWRGLAAGIIANTVKSFNKNDELTAYLGPAIGPQAFEVGAEVKSAFEQAMGPGASQCFISGKTKSSHYYGDLFALARLQLAALGIADVAGGGVCTFNDARFYSFRRQAKTGRFVSAIWLT